MQGCGKSGEGVWCFWQPGFFPAVIQKWHKGVTVWPKGWVELMQGFGFPENGFRRRVPPRVPKEFTFLGDGLPGEDAANCRHRHQCASHRQHYHPAAQQRPLTSGKGGRFPNFISPCCGGLRCAIWWRRRRGRSCSGSCADFR
jgi:hypothetical protein